MVCTGGETTSNSRESPYVINIVKTNRLRYAGHMIIRPEDLLQNAILKARPQGTRRQARPKSRWVDGMNSDSRALGAPYWMNRAQDREQRIELHRQALTAPKKIICWSKKFGPLSQKTHGF
jgi:hypothetical protein